MRKIAILCSLVLFMMFENVNAEISKKSDDFTGGVVISSNIKLTNEFIEEIKLEKSLSSNNNEYSMKISDVSSKDYFIKNSAIEIKIDDFPVYELNNYSYNLNKSSKNQYLFNSNITAKISEDIISKIKKSNRVAIRFENISGDERVYVLQDNVLAEWKQVIGIQTA